MQEVLLEGTGRSDGAIGEKPATAPYARDVRLALVQHLRHPVEKNNAAALSEALRAINPEEPLLQPRS